ncbi:MAG: ATP-binding protein [Mariprofundus sp.]
MIKWPSRIFVGYAPGKAQDSEYQCKAIALIATVAMPTAFIFAIINYTAGHLWLTLVEVFTFLLLIPCLNVIRQKESLPSIRNLLMANAFMVFTTAFVDGGIAGTGIIWSLVIPFLAFLLMGLRTGWYWVASYGLINILLISLHFSGQLTLAYTSNTLIYFPAVFIFFALIAASFELQLERTYAQHQNTIHKLETLKENLEELVAGKTSELTKANEQLKQAINEHEDTAKALKASEELFRHAQKMEAIGVLVGGIAHDFNNFLAGITGNLYLLKTRLKEQPELLNRVSTIDQLCFKAADMISQLLAFARKDHVEMRYMSFTAFVKDSIKLALLGIPDNIRLKQDIAPDELTVFGNISQLQQVVLNMLNNARDALEHIAAPEILVKLAPFTADDAFRQKHNTGDSDGEYAHLSIQDNGCGISDTDLPNVFDPFFTTKECGKGTGLGLAMAFGSIQSHGGVIDVESKPGCGSTFHIYLPIQNMHAELEALQSQDICAGHGETILLADDNPQIRETVGEVLENIGYQVLLAADGREAIALFEQHQGKIALSILDLIMPEMSGRDAAEKIHSLDMSAPVLFSTGYDKLNTLRLEDDIPSDQIMGKPFSIEELSSKIDRFMRSATD